MTSETPASDRESADHPGATSTRIADGSGNSSSGRRAVPSRSSGKHPLPSPWPQPEDEPAIFTIDDEPRVPSIAPKRELPKPANFTAADQPSAPSVTGVTPPRRLPAPEIATVNDALRAPSVTPQHWLPEPDYWLADHQRVPRPPTRPIPRPKRFRRTSYVKSFFLALFILLGIALIGAGMVTAGQLSYQFFNTPKAAPTTRPANAAPTSPADNATPTTTPDNATPTPGSDSATPTAAAMTP